MNFAIFCQIRYVFDAAAGITIIFFLSVLFCIDENDSTEPSLNNFLLYILKNKLPNVNYF